MGAEICYRFVSQRFDVPFVDGLGEDSAVCKYLNDFSDVCLIRDWVPSRLCELATFDAVCEHGFEWCRWVP